MVDSELVVSQSAEGKHLCATQDAVETAAKQMERVDSAMLLKSDIVIDVAKFEPSAISEQTAKLNKEVIQISASGPKWFEVSRPISPMPLFYLIYLGRAGPVSPNAN